MNNRKTVIHCSLLEFLHTARPESVGVRNEPAARGFGPDSGRRERRNADTGRQE